MPAPEIEFFNDAWKKQRGYIEANAKHAKRGLVPDMKRGRTVMICGAGPSLAEDFDQTHQRVQPDEVWGCNSALSWLYKSGRRMTHGVAVAGEDGLVDDWKPFPRVTYYVASGVSPVIINLLRKKYHKVFFFHNLLGFLPRDQEIELYAKLYPAAICVQSGGFNVTNRAVAVASAMGYRKIVVVGADCCFRLSDDAMPVPGAEVSDEDADRMHWEWVERQQMYADGRSPVTAFGRTPVLEGWLAGRRVVSRPDMLLSAQSLVEMTRMLGNRLELVGDTLPNWLLRMPEEEWRESMPKVGDGGTVVNLGRKKA